MFLIFVLITILFSDEEQLDRKGFCHQYIRANRSYVSFSSKKGDPGKSFTFQSVFRKSINLAIESNFQSGESNPDAKIQSPAESAATSLQSVSESISFEDDEDVHPIAEEHGNLRDKGNLHSSSCSELCPFCMAFISDSESAVSLTQEDVGVIILASKKKKDPDFVCKTGQMVHTNCKTNYTIFEHDGAMSSTETSESVTFRSDAPFEREGKENVVSVRGTPFSWDSMGMSLDG